MGQVAVGTKLQQWGCNGTPAQQFVIVPSGDGDWVYIKDAWSGLCWDVPNGDTSNGVHIALWTCHGGLNQKFWFSGSGWPNIKGSVRIKSSNKCVDIYWGSSAQGQAVQQWDCNNYSGAQVSSEGLLGGEGRWVEGRQEEDGSL